MRAAPAPAPADQGVPAILAPCEAKVRADLGRTWLRANDHALLDYRRWSGHDHVLAHDLGSIPHDDPLMGLASRCERGEDGP